MTKITSSGPQSGGTDTSSANEGRESTVDLRSEETYTVGISSFSWETEFSEAGAYDPIEQEGCLQDIWVGAFRDGEVAGLPAYQDYFAFS